MVKRTKDEEHEEPISDQPPSKRQQVGDKLEIACIVQDPQENLDKDVSENVSSKELGKYG